MSFFYKKLHRILCSFFVIHQNTVTGNSLNLTVYQHDWLTCFLEFLQMCSSFIYWHINDPIHSAADQKLHCLLLQLLICTTVTDDGCITVTSENIFHSRYDLSTEYIIQLRDYNSYGLCRICLKPSGNFIYLIMEFLNSFFNLYSVFFPDVSPVKIGRDCSQTKSCQSGYIFHCCRHFIFLPCRRIRRLSFLPLPVPSLLR